MSKTKQPSALARRGQPAPVSQLPKKRGVRRTVQPSPRQFHEVLLQSLEEKGMSKGQLATYAGRDPSTVTAWIQGRCKPTRQVYFKLRHLFPDLALFAAEDFEDASQRYPDHEPRALVAAEPGAALSEVPDLESDLPRPASLVRREDEPRRPGIADLVRFGRETTWFHEEKPVPPQTLMGILERAQHLSLSLDELVEVLQK